MAVVEHVGLGEPERSQPRAALEEVAGRVQPTTLARERVVPVLDPLGVLFPDGGLRRGSTVVVEGSGGAAGATSLALALTARATAEGSWCAAVGCADLGFAAAAELGVDLVRLAVVPAVGRDEWPTVVAALLDALTVVVAWPPPRLRTGDARRLVARARERGSVLVAVGGWGEGADVRLRAGARSWAGVGRGHGHLRGRQVEVEGGGRGAAARARRAVLWLPGPHGRVAVAGAATGDAAAGVAGSAAGAGASVAVV